MNSDDQDEEEDMCSVCFDGTWTAGDPIVYCDGCNVTVHKECYGYPLVNRIPDDEWLCAKCFSSKDSKASTSGDIHCELCPLKEGAMKRTTEWQWCHLSCALWVPEVFFHSADGREAIDITQVPPRRWEGLCKYCNTKDGACIDCKEPGCKTRYHVTCGLQKESLMKYNTSTSGMDSIVSYCAEHSAIIRKKKNWKAKFYNADD